MPSLLTFSVYFGYRADEKSVKSKVTLGPKVEAIEACLT